MDIRYLQSLLAVIENGSIARAAGVQNLTAAGVGQRIQALERELSVSLLTRDSHRAYPTEACLNMLPRIRRIIAESRQLAADADSSGLSGKFHLGAISTALTGLLPNVIKTLATSAPDLTLQIIPGTSKALFTELRHNNIDAAITVLPSHPIPSSLKHVVIRREKLMLLSNGAQGKTIQQKLQRNPYIAYDSESWGGAKAKQFLLDNGLDIQAYCELDGLEAIEKLVQQQMGVSLVPSWAGFNALDSHVENRTIKDAAYARDVVLLMPENTSRPQVMKMLSDILCKLNT